MVELKKYKKVVFIDDDVDLANSYVQKLKEKNLADYLICFSNVKDALGYLSKSKKRDLPDYILLDLYFAGMNGFEFLSHLEKNHSWNGSPEIYVCSNSRNEQDRKQAMKYPFVSAFIEKPLSADFIELLITDEQL